MKNHINVNEIFGPTIQGEGPHTGQRVAFLRVAGCNLACSWCDTPYSWDWSRYDHAKESHPYTVQEVANELNQYNVKRIILTGGEPLLQQTNIANIHQITGLLIDVETNGTRLPTQETIEAVDLFVVSPKLKSAGDKQTNRIKPEVLSQFNNLAKQGKAIFKFVIANEDDWNEMQTVTSEINPEHIWIMAEGLTAETQLTNMPYWADKAITHGYNFTPRLHTLIWSQERRR